MACNLCASFVRRAAPEVILYTERESERERARAVGDKSVSGSWFKAPRRRPRDGLLLLLLVMVVAVKRAV